MKDWPSNFQPEETCELPPFLPAEVRYCLVNRQLPSSLCMTTSLKINCHLSNFYFNSTCRREDVKEPRLGPHDPIIITLFRGGKNAHVRPGLILSPGGICKHKQAAWSGNTLSRDLMRMPNFFCCGNLT